MSFRLSGQWLTNRWEPVAILITVTTPKLNIEFTKLQTFLFCPYSKRLKLKVPAGTIASIMIF